MPLLMIVLFGFLIPSLLFFLGWIDWISELRGGIGGPPTRFYDPLAMGVLFGLPAAASGILAERAYSVYLRHRWPPVMTISIVCPLGGVVAGNLLVLNACVDWSNPRVVPLRFWLHNLVSFAESGFLYFASGYGLVVSLLAVSWLVLRYPHETPVVHEGS